MSCSLSTQPPELGDRGWEQNEALIIQGEMVSDLLQHSDTQASGALWDPPKGAELPLTWTGAQFAG